MRQALTERQSLIDARATAILDTALNDGQSWVAGLGAPPKDARAAAAWRRHLLTVAAYRDRYGMTGPAPIGVPPEGGAQKVDAARARAALDRARRLDRTPDEPQERPGTTRVRQL